LQATRALAREVDLYLPSRDEFLALWNATSLDQAAEAYRLFDQGVGGKGVFLM